MIQDLFKEVVGIVEDYKWLRQDMPQQQKIARGVARVRHATGEGKKTRANRNRREGHDERAPCRLPVFWPWQFGKREAFLEQ